MDGMILKTVTLRVSTFCQWIELVYDPEKGMESQKYSEDPILTMCRPVYCINFILLIINYNRNIWARNAHRLIEKGNGRFIEGMYVFGKGTLLMDN